MRSRGVRLVEKQELRISDQRTRDGQPLLLSARQRTDSRIALLFELDLVDYLSDIARLSIEALKESQRLIHRKLLGELGVLELDSEQLAEITRVRLPVSAKHFDAPRVGREKAFADLDRSRLASAIGAEEAEALPGLDLEVETINCDDVIVGLPESLDSKGGRGIIEGCHHWTTRSVTARGQ